jgi:hypothetical protein
MYITTVGLSRLRSDGLQRCVPVPQFVYKFRTVLYTVDCDALVDELFSVTRKNRAFFLIKKICHRKARIII